MTDDDVALAAALDEDLTSSEYVFRTLPSRQFDPSAQLKEAIANFDAGDRQAAREATEWLQQRALDSYRWSRTRLLLGQGRIAGYYSLASAGVKLSPANKEKHGLPSYPYIPGTLLTWIAKDQAADVSGGYLLLDAYSRIAAVGELQASPLLMINAADDETAEMWIQRYGFRHINEKGKNSRTLWLPLPDL